MTAGNFVSVNGNVITEGGGTAFTANVNGTDLSNDEISSYGVSKDDDITIGNGSDVTEDYSSTYEDIQPTLRMEGTYGSIAYISQWGQTGQKETRTGSVSGETQEVTVKEAQDVVVTLHMASPDNGQKLVALTFDDGPSETYTQRYLDILNTYGIHATFFELGQNVSKYPEIAAAVAASGNQIASHSQTHPELTSLDTDTLQSELTQSFDAIYQATGISTTVIRPPYGEFRESTWLKTNGLISVSVTWTQDSEDWKKPGVDSIVSYATKNISSGSIILMHDGGGNRDEDLEALPTIIETLQNEGYTFVTINELMQSDSSIPSDIATGNATMPDGSVWPTELGDA